MIKRLLQAAVAASALIAISFTAALSQSAVGVERSGNGYLKRVCTMTPAEGTARCHAEVATDAKGTPLGFAMRPQSSSVLGAVPYYARDLWSAYYGTTTRPAPPPGARPTVAVVAAYGYGQAVSDLTKYRQLNGLPPLCSATVTSGCVTFTRLNQSGVAGSYPVANKGWAQEQALDVQMVSALCPWCNVVLVEANSSSYANLGKAEVMAASLPGVVAISNSYGGAETGSSLYAASFSPSNTVVNGYAGKISPSIAIVASAGDSGYAGGAEFPSSSPFVLSIGGTTLTYASGVWTEKTWAKTGSGCSKVYSQMAWQSPLLPSTACIGRVASDVSTVADVNTGVAAVYRGTIYRYGGTSVGAPIIAGIIGQRNQPISLTLNAGTVVSATYPTPSGGTIASSYGKNLYGQRGALRDVTSGSNGSCSIGFICTAGAGYDGPTGLGSPRGSLSPF